MSQARHPILDPALRAVQWSVRHPRTVIGLALAAVALALLSFSRVRVSASLHAMLGESSSVGAAMQRISGQYHAADSLLLMADLPPGDHPDGRTELLRFAASFQAAAASDPDAKEVIAYVRSGQEPELARFAREVMLPSAAYYLSDAGLTELVARLDCDEIGRQIARNEALVAAPGPAGSTLSSNVLRDPLRLFELVPPSMAGAGASAMSLEQSTNEPEWSRDRRAILIRVGGTRPPGELAAARRLVDVVERLARGANAGGLSLRFAGAAPVAAHSSGVIKADSI
ncbi:MAG: hypothetical protein ACOYN0_10265, partial [Phycisphaerales bacterium]